ncbi:MAG TPA: porin family protein [Balneolales bacterium]|nr:porin family protein [Balneolales bacterium]
MKRTIIGLLTLTFLTCFHMQNVKAQSQVSGGIKGGVSIFNFTGKDVSGSGIYTALNGGLFVDFSPSRVFSVQPELNVKSEGANYGMMINGFPYRRARVTYLQVPILLKLSPFNNGSKPAVSPSIFAGPAFNVMLFKQLNGEVLPDVTGGYSIDQNPKQTAYSVIGGVGVTIKNLYIIDLRYEKGLTNVFKQGDIKSGGIMITTGFKF